MPQIRWFTVNESQASAPANPARDARCVSPQLRVTRGSPRCCPARHIAHCLAPADYFPGEIF